MIYSKRHAKKPIIYKVKHLPANTFWIQPASDTQTMEKLDVVGVSPVFLTADPAGLLKSEELLSELDELAADYARLDDARIRATKAANTYKWFDFDSRERFIENYTRRLFEAQ